MNNLVDIDNSRDNNRANGNVIVEDTIDLINFQNDDQNIHQNQQGRNLPRHFNAQQSSTQLNQQTFNDLTRVTPLTSQYANRQPRDIPARPQLPEYVNDFDNRNQQQQFPTMPNRHIRQNDIIGSTIKQIEIQR